MQLLKLYPTSLYSLVGHPLLLLHHFLFSPVLLHFITHPYINNMMYSIRRNGSQNEAKNPSFSSTLLDKIYRSIDEGERKSGDMKFYRETTTLKKQSRSNVKCNREKEETQWRQRNSHRHRDRDHHHEQDVMFFSSTSSSSDSSSGGLSSSDTESMYGTRSRASCFAPHWPKPVRTSVCEKSEKKLTERRQNTLFHEQKGVQMFDDYSHHNSKTRSIERNEEGLIKSKSRAMKIYNNLKKVKQPISPGGKLTNFLNSLFTTGNTKKSQDVNDERKAKSGQASTCSSASSFSRSCLSKTSPSSREKLHNGVKRTVRFYPVSVIVDEDSRPCGHKCLYEEEDTSLVPMSVPTAWKIGVKKNEEEVKRRGVEEAAREFLKEYHRNKKKSDLVLRNFPMSINEDEDDDAASCSSSDLFELDHLTVMGNKRYCEELPVYETTHFRTNRVIANGLIM